MTETQTGDVSAVRERSYAWADPTPTLQALPGTAGVDVLKRMLAGELPPPPIMATLGVEAGSFEVGSASFTMQPEEFHYNPLGTVHGGVIAMLLDSAAGCAVHSTLSAGEGYTSVDLTTKYLRPVTAASGRVTATGTVLSRGSRTALAQAQLTDDAGRLLAHATSTCLIFPIG
ncbi:PaaI family thioesterase [Spongisporangium articulatum]|uniref:PaaI family thioesterase n=1 Tax=Spongisporangium articulatum TaxID=3362603 RepID=A0ABW8AHY7_9ACTN